MKGKVDSKAQIYGVYWKIENPLLMVWKIIQDILKQKSPEQRVTFKQTNSNTQNSLEFFQFDDFLKKLENEVQQRPEYCDGIYSYLPREVYIESVLKVFYEIFYPSELNCLFWREAVQQTFQQLSNLVSIYLNIFKTDEVRQIIFLLNFRNEIFGSNVFTQEEGNNFVQFANEVKVPFKEPQKIVEIILNYRPELIERQAMPDTKKRLDQMIIKFICEFIIDAADEDQDVEVQFLIDNIIKELVITDELKQTPLQFITEFKNNLPKLLNIIVKNISSTTYIHFLNEELIEEQKLQEDEEDIDENEQYSRDCYVLLDQFINEAPQLKNQDPFIITLNDLIEAQDYFLSEENIGYCLQNIKQIITNTAQSQVSLKKIVAIATFKKIIKLYEQDLLNKFSTNQNPQFETLEQHLDNFFDFESNIQKEQLFPFAIFIMKLMNRKLDILAHHSKFFVQNNKWVSKYINITLPEGMMHAQFSYLNDNQFQMAMSAMENKIDQLDQFFKENNSYSIRKMAGILKIIELTYFADKKLKDEKLLKALTDNQFSQYQALGADLQIFLRPFITLQFDQFQSGRNKFIKFSEKDNTQAYYSKLLWMYLGAACHSENTFMRQFFLSPELIKECYVPFVQNIKIDSQASINKMDDLTVLKCKFCQNSIFAVQLPKSSKMDQRKGARIEESKRKKILGKKICNFCKNNGFNGGKFEFNEDHHSDKEAACKSYVVLNIKDYKQYTELRVRDLSLQELSIGRIILHSIMLLTVVFSSNKETEIFSLIKGLAKVQSDQYKDTLQETLAYIGKSIIYDWKTLRKIWCVNDDKVLQIIQRVIFGIVKDPTQFTFDGSPQCKTTEWRDNIEIAFKKICQEILKDRNKFFMENINPKIQGESQLLELDQVSCDSYQNLLRVQNKITIKQFSMTLRDQQHKGENFFKILFEQTQVVQSIQLLKPLLNWAMFIQNKYNAQLTLEEANETSIRDIIEREKKGNTGNQDYIDKIYKRFQKFQSAWNQFAGITIRDGNVEATIPQITLDSKIMYCCLSSISNENDNYIFFLLLKFLAIQQNKLLYEAEAMMSKENDFCQKEESKYRQNSIAIQKLTESRSQGIQQYRTQSFPKINLSEVKSDQLIYYRENQIDKQLSSAQQQKLEDQEKEKLEKIIIKNSICKFEYGKGKQIEYNFAQIKKASIELLLQGKSKIDFNQPISFQFINAGNLLTQFKELNKRIPQDSARDMINDFLKNKKDQDTIYRCLNQLRTLLNYICNLSIRNVDMTISDFMRMLQITKEDRDDLFPHKNIKLKHIIYIYEELELQVEHIEVEGVNKKYQEQSIADNVTAKLNNFQEKLNLKKLNAIDDKFSNRRQRNAEDELYKEIEIIMHVIARLCNRNLRQYHKEIATKNIFEYLIEEDSNKKLFIKYSDLLRYQKDRRDSIPSKAANENPLPRGAMVTIVDETMLTQSELHYDIEEIRKVEEYLLYYISTEVQVRQAKQLYDILFKEMQIRDENVRKQLEEEQRKKDDAAKEQQTHLVSEDTSFMFQEIKKPKPVNVAVTKNKVQGKGPAKKPKKKNEEDEDEEEEENQGKYHM